MQTHVEDRRREAKHGQQPEKPGDGGELDALLGKSKEGNRGIRCPKCQWRPRKDDRWGCLCGHSWNTFDTHGICPKCHAEWRDTQCLKCHEWSKHVDWYEGGKQGPQE